MVNSFHAALRVEDVRPKAALDLKSTLLSPHALMAAKVYAALMDWVV